MQVGGAIQGRITIPWHKRLNVVVAMVALLVWAGTLVRSGVGAEDANPNNAGAGSAVIHDDAGQVHPD